MKPWLKIATALLFVSVVTFSLKKPTFFWDKTNINDLSLALSFLFFCIALYKKEIAVTIPKKLYLWFEIGFGAIVLGTAISLIAFHIVAPYALREYARIIACFMIAIEIYAIGSATPRFNRTILLLLTATSVVFPFIVYSTPSVLHFFLDESQTRFTGFLYDPNYFATLQILPAFILLWIAASTDVVRHTALRLLSFFLFSMSIGVIFWSGSRGGIAGFLIGLCFLVILAFWKLPLKRAAMFGAMVTAGFALSYVLMPPLAHQNISARVSSIASAPVAGSAAGGAQITVLQKITGKLEGQQGRFPIWKSALIQIRRNPLGYGPDYGNIVDIQGANNDHHRVAHNSILQILLTGGIVLFVCVAVGAVVLAKNALSKGMPFSTAHMLFATLVGIAVAAVFLDSLWSRWIWIIIPLIAIEITRHHDEYQRN